MARYVATVPSTRPADEVFAYLADFRSVKDWDPSVVSSEHTNDGDPIALGAQFTVAIKMLGNTTSLDYETVEFDRPRRFVLRGENSTVVSTDTVTVKETPGGCEMTYDADLQLKSVLKLADPLMGLALKKLGANAKAGLTEQLNP